MNRTRYYNYIEEKLHILSYRIAQRGKFNLLELNIHAETFFSDLLNILFDYELINLNTIKQNIEGIDLVDTKNHVIAQVSATCSKQKVENSLAKMIFKDYPDYKFKFISIAKDADKLRKETFANPYKALFEPTNDIIDVSSLLKIILYIPIEKQEMLYEFIKKELGTEIDVVKVDTNLATIINILAAENLSTDIDSPEINSFEIDKKVAFNCLEDVKNIIDDYKIYYHKLDEKYTEFDKEGKNKSLSVFQIIRTQYNKLQTKINDPKELFFNIVDNIIDIIQGSKNYSEIAYEELEICVHILVIDAFIRCKIFKNPEGYNHVVTR